MQNRFQSSLGRPFNRDSDSNLNVIGFVTPDGPRHPPGPITRASDDSWGKKHTDKVFPQTPFPRVRKLTNETLSGILKDWPLAVIRRPFQASNVLR